MLEKRAFARAACKAAPWIFAAAVAVMPFAVSAQSPLPGGVESMVSGEASPAKAVTVGAPKLVDLRAVPQITAKQLAAAGARRPLPRPRTMHTEQQFAALKAQAAKLRFDTPNLSPMTLTVAPAAGSIAAGAGTEGVLTPIAAPSFIGNTQGTTPTGCAVVPFFNSTVTPADMALAVGDTFVGVLQVNNVCLSVFDKSGAIQAGFPKPLASLVGLDPTTTCVSDPRALYDWVQHRYIVAFVQLNCANILAGGFGIPSSYWVAVSTADSPTATYNAYNIASGFPAPVLIDFPRLGQDRQAVYVASNVFATDAAGIPIAYDGEEWLLLPKTAMYAGTALAGFAIDNPLHAFMDSSQPANVFSKMDNPRAEFFVTSENFLFGGGSCITGCNGLVVWAVSNPLGVGGTFPEVSAVFVPTTFTYFLPPGAIQKGTPFLIDTNDVRISGEVSYAAGSLYAALTTADGTGAAGSILYKIQPLLNVNGNGHCTGPAQNLCPDITRAVITSENFIIAGGSNSAYFATQQPDPEGNVTTVFNLSGPTFFASTAYISTRVTQGLGASVNNYVNGFFLQQGQNIYTEACNQFNACRWGDYTGVAPAGEAANSNSPEMWFAGMFTQLDGTWGTWIGRNRYSTPDQF